MEITKSYYKIDEACEILKMTKDELLEFMQQKRIRVSTYVNGNLKFSKQIIRKIEKAFYSKTYYKEKRVGIKPKVKMVKKMRPTPITPRAWYPKQRKKSDGLFYPKFRQKKLTLEL
jgi:hypothetical protein